MYALTGDTLYKEKAQLVADKLLPAFDTPTGIPNALVNINSGVSKHFLHIFMQTTRISCNRQIFQSIPDEQKLWLG